LGEALWRVWPDAFSATNDVSMNASFVVEVQLNERLVIKLRHAWAPESSMCGGGEPN
jgi:hypothetical protein